MSRLLPLPRQSIVRAGLILSLASPAAAQEAADLERGCPLPEGGSSAVVGGIVRDLETQIPLPGARITLSWKGDDGLRIESDADGRYLACGIPVDQEVRARVRFPGRRGSAEFTLRPSTRIATVDFELEGDVPITTKEIVSIISVGREATSGGTILQGTVVDDESEGTLAGAQVAFAGTGQVTDAAGRFRIEAPPAGNHLLRIEFLGYVPANQHLEIRRGEQVTVGVRLVPTAIAMRALEVRLPLETTAEQRRRRAHTAYVVDAEEIALYPAMDIPELIERTVPGAQLSLNPPSGAFNPGCPSIVFRSGVGSAGFSAAGGRPNWFEARVLVIVDGAKFRDTCILESLRSEEIDRIEVYPGPAGAAIYGLMGGDGVIIVTTKWQAGRR